AQRIKIATELSKLQRAKHTVYILDEPTTGLHLADVQRLLESLNRLVDAGHTVLLIEHHLDVIKTAEHVIDLGPEGGHAGGEVVATGTPEAIAACKASHTGCFLKAHLRALLQTCRHPQNALREILADGPLPIREVTERMRALGVEINYRMLWRARKAAGVHI